MARSFLSINANYNDFLSLPSRGVNKFVLENNEHILSKLYGFCQKSDNILVVSGFIGTGKTSIVNHLLNYIDKNVYSFKINCSNSSCVQKFISSALLFPIVPAWRQGFRGRS